MTNPFIDAAFDAMTTWHYVWVVTKDAEGFWAHTDDNIHYRTNVLAELQQRTVDMLKSRQYGDEMTVKKLINRLRMYSFAYLDEFKPDSRIVPFANGVYYIDQHQFLPHGTDIEEGANILGITPLEYSHKTFSIIPHNFNIEAESIEEWDDFVNLVFDNDKVAIQTLYEWVGYCCTTKIDKKKFLMGIGPKDSAKTTLSRILLNAIGQDNFSLVKFYQICSQDPFVRYNIIDMRVNLDDDIGKHKIEDIDQILDLTGGLDYINVNPKHEKPYKHYHITRFWTLCNQIPPIKGLGIPIAGRILLFRFKHVFSNTTICPACNKLHKIDSTFESRMKAEPIAEYILKRAILALGNLLERQSFVSQSDEEILDILRLELEPVYGFLHEFCIVEGQEYEGEIIHLEDVQCTQQSELYDAFVEYLDDNGIKSPIDSQRKFTEQMINYGHRTKDTHQQGWNATTQKFEKNTHVKVYRGVVLKDKLFFKNKPAEPKEEEGKHDTINPFEINP